MKKYILDVSKLRPGDVILVGYNDEKSRKIQQETNCDYSHAMLYWYDSVIHAADLIITENPSRMLFDEDEKVCVRRLRKDYRQPMRIKLLIDYALSWVGTLYDSDALKSLEAHEAPFYNPNRQMCSKFVAQCFEHVLVDLSDDYNTCTPKDIFESDELVTIPDCIMEAAQWDIDFAESKDVTRLQYNAIFIIIARLHKLLPEADIMNLKQLEDYISSNPQRSDEILNIIKRTDYLALWQIEQEYCPYLYDVDLFKQKWGGKSIAAADDMRLSSMHIITEKENDIGFYRRQIINIGELEYYKAMIELRESIINQARKRIDIANKVLGIRTTSNNII